MSDSDKSNEKLIKNEGTNSGETDVRERLTLHVRKRVSGELVVVKQETMTTTADTKGASSKKKAKRTKKKAKNNVNKTPRSKTKIKQEKSPVDSVNFENRRPKTETPEVCSDEPGSTLQSPAVEIDEAAAQSARESFLNNAILNEILDQKKRELFESEEIMQLIRERMCANN